MTCFPLGIHPRHVRFHKPVPKATPPLREQPLLDHHQSVLTTSHLGSHGYYVHSPLVHTTPGRYDSIIPCMDSTVQPARSTTLLVFSILPATYPTSYVLLSSQQRLCLISSATHLESCLFADGQPQTSRSLPASNGWICSSTIAPTRMLN